MWFTEYLSLCPYGSMEEVLHVVVTINGMVYLLINQSETFDILGWGMNDTLTEVIDIVGGQEQYERMNFGEVA